jgi:3-methyl-2-oxobutanoate hydroxymethyltransferase
MESTVTALDLVAAKGKRRLVMVTASDEPSARLADRAGVDIVLVGDSLAMAALGRPDTLSVTLDEMIHHTRAAAAGARHALLVGDMPFGSYQTSVRDAVHSAVRLVGEGGARAVKLEGPRALEIAAIVAAGIPVMAHLGLTPQSLHGLGGYRVQAETASTPCPSSSRRGRSRRPGRSAWCWRPSHRRSGRRSRARSASPRLASGQDRIATAKCWSSPTS